MHCSLVAEHLAPFQDGDVQEVIVCGDPELFTGPRLSCIMRRTVEGKVTKAVEAELRGPA